MGPQEHALRLPRLVLDTTFEDMDSYGAATGGWDLDFRQLEAGALEARAALIVSSRRAALRVRFNRQFHQQGSPPKGLLVFGLPDEPLSWCGTLASVGDVLNFNRRDGFEGVSEAGFSGTVLFLDPRDLREPAADQGLDFDSETGIRSTGLWRGAGARVEGLRDRILRVFEFFREPGNEVTAGTLMNRDVPSELLTAITTSEETFEREDSTTRTRALASALDSLDDPDAFPLGVRDLCRAAGVSASTLYRAFHEHFGVGPKRYLQLRSLNGVRSELLRAAQGSKVSDLAGRWGFWHMSQFAADYRRQFGELPSETLARR